jgi:condensin-2 complex subunit D3
MNSTQIIQYTDELLAEIELNQLLSSLPSFSVNALHTRELSELEAAELNNIITQAFHNQYANQLLQLAQKWRQFHKNNEDSTGEDISLWTNLATNSIQSKNLLCLISILLDTPSTVSISISELYIILLALPGRPIQFFHAETMRKSFNLLKKWSYARIEQQFQAKKTKNLKGKHMNQALEENPFAMDDEKALESVTVAKFNMWAADSDQSDMIIVQLLESAAELFNPENIHCLKLSRYDEVLSHCVESLVEITRTAANNDKKGLTVMQPAYWSYKILKDLLSLHHGQREETLNIICKNFLPSILLNFIGISTSTLPRHLLGIQQLAIEFLIANAAAVPNYEKPLLYLLQHISVHSPDRAEYRKNHTAVILQLLCAFPGDRALQPFTSFLLRLSRNSKASYRLFALDLSSQILDTPALLEKFCPENHSALQKLLNLLLARCSDKGVSVRARALTCLANSVQVAAQNEQIRRQFSTLLADYNNNLNDSLENNSSPSSLHNNNPDAAGSATPSLNRSAPSQDVSFLQTPLNTTHNSSINLLNNSMEANTPRSPFHPVNHCTGNGLRAVLQLLHRRSADPRAAVRKAAILAVESILLGGESAEEVAHSTEGSEFIQSLTAEDFSVFYDGCLDSSVALRKQAMISLSKLWAKYYENPVVQKIWLGAVLPMITDTQNSIQEKNQQLIQEFFLEKLISALEGRNQATFSEFGGVFSLFALFDEDCIRYFQLSVQHLIKRKLFPELLIKQLNKTLGSSQHRALWIIAQELANNNSYNSVKLDARQVFTAWKNSAHSSSNNAEFMLRMLNCLASLSNSLSTEQSNEICTQLRRQLLSFDSNMSPALIQAGLQLFSALDIDSTLFYTQLLNQIQQDLERFILQRESISDELLSKYLFAIGEMALSKSVLILSRQQLITFVQALISPQYSNSIRAHA